MSVKLPIYSPSKLNLFQRCPYSYWRRYIDRSMPRMQSTPAQARGQVTHTILKHAIRAFAGGGNLPDSVQQDARKFMSHHEHLTPDQVAFEVQHVDECATFALDHLNVRAEPVVIERRMDYVWRTKSGKPRVRLQPQADLVLRHPEGVWEIIDWKTGASTYPDMLQNLILYVTATNYLRGRYEIDKKAIKLTNAYLSARRHVQVDVSREALAPNWEYAAEVIRRIESETEWQATRNALCEFCPLFENGCPLEPCNQEMR